MPRMRTLLFVCLVACSSSKPAATTAPVTATPTEQPAPKPVDPNAGKPVDPTCGTRPTDWCPAPAGDACGDHKDTASCKADPRCAGMKYRGESLVACQYDARGFASNCPTVGCVSAAR